MRKDIKYLLTSLPFLVIGIAGLIIEINQLSGFLWIIINISMICFFSLFILFLHYNHKLALADYSIETSLREYGTAIIVSMILMIAGILGALIGFASNAILYTQIMFGLAISSLTALIYCIFRYNDIKSEENQSTSERPPA